MTMRTAILLIGLLAGAAAGQPLATSDFEQGLAGWQPLWTRAPGAGQVAVDTTVFHAGKAAARIEHRGAQDWSLTYTQRFPVRAGDLLELAGWVKIDGGGEATLAVTAYGADGKALDWSLGGRSLTGPADWKLVQGRLVIPAKVTEVQPRLIGSRPGTVWLDDFSLKKTGTLAALRDPDLPADLTIRNAALEVTLHLADATLAVRDLRTGQTWAQHASANDLLVKAAKAQGAQIQTTLLDLAQGQDLRITFALDAAAPELLVTLAGAGAMRPALDYPHPFTAPTSEPNVPAPYLVIPINEGISFPVDDPVAPPERMIAYGGHGICMAFFGTADPVTGRGQMALLETPDDAVIHTTRVDGRLCSAPEWQPQRGEFGYDRKVRYVFFDRGGHVAMAKRYRAYAQATGNFKTLAAKREENPNVDLLVGAVNAWCWDKDGPGIVRDMQAAGIGRILWSNAQSAENLAALNALPGVLTSRYDIYQDVMDPAQFPKLRGVHGDWTTAAWPKDLMRNARGDWVRGWQVEARDGSMIPCGTLCDRQAVAYAQERIPAELKTKPYRCRFIDTTTASPWRECYDPAHPMTRTDSRKWKMELLRYVSAGSKLVCGSETGHDAAVPYVHYFEGMLSLGFYRVPDSGRAMSRILDEVPERVAKYQVGQAYRLPLWELVYHDCVIAQWYWGDYNNKLPAIWDKRDLFNVLYGTPPMFMFNRDLWAKNKERFVRSYQTTCPVARATGYAEMTDHRFLTSDRNVQQTTFANGVTVTVNFGEKAYRMEDGTEVGAMGNRVQGMK